LNSDHNNIIDAPAAMARDRSSGRATWDDRSNSVLHPERIHAMRIHSASKLCKLPISDWLQQPRPAMSALSVYRLQGNMRREPVWVCRAAARLHPNINCNAAG